MRIRGPYMVLFVVVLALNSCVVKKKKDDISATKKFYHNTTAYYNAFFNAEEILAESILNMQNAHVDNYNQILSVYDYINLQNPKLEASKMDIVVEKVSKSAALHRQSHWVDDCYVMIGKAQFFKQDYETAEETFLFFEEEFDPKNPYGKNYDPGKDATRAQKEMQRKREKKVRDNNRKVEKKEREQTEKEKKKQREAEKKERDRARKQQLKDRKKGIRPDRSTSTRTPEGQVASAEEKAAEEKEKKEKEEEEKEEEVKDGPFAHPPAYWEGLYWLGRVLIERQNYSSAEYYLNKVTGSDAVATVRNEIPAARAHLKIRNKDYDEALIYLEEAIQSTKEKVLKARYAYIKAQINENLGNTSAAFKEFERCKSFKPGFEMAFYADLNEIKLSHSVGKYSSDQAIKKMEKMIEEDKYRDFIGAIYFAIGQVLLNDGNMTAGIEAFKKATSEGAQDPEIFYRLATLLFEQEDYAGAKTYFDKTLSLLPKSDERYFEVKKYASSLTDIALMIEEVKLQDSILTLANLPDDELRERAALAVENMGEAELSPSEPDNRNTTAGRRYGSGRSSFFAYNPIALNQGKVEFERTWGDVALVDNWRRSSVINTTREKEEEEDGVDEEANEEAIEAFIASLPRTKIEQDLVNRKLSDAMFNLGLLYRDKLENSEKSNATLSSLIKRYPTFQPMDQVYFYQYLNSLDLNDLAEAERYKKNMLAKFPDSKYTLIATDPNYVKEQLAEENQLTDYYDATYSMFENQNYEQVRTRVDESNGMFGVDNEYAPKFALLSAMSVGKISGKEEYVIELEKLVKKFPNTSENTRAKEILRFLKGDQEAFSSLIYEEELLAFEADEEAQHYVIVIAYDASGRDVDSTKISISNFNRTFFKSDRLQLSDITLNRELNSHLVLVRKFSNQAKAMDYYETAQKNEDKFITNGVSYEYFPVSQQNYREVIKQNSVKNYRQFFETEYLGN